MLFADFDNAGRLDLYLGNMPDPKNNHAGCVLLKNDGKGNFTDVSKDAGLHHPRADEDYAKLDFLPPADRERVLEPFWRADKAHTAGGGVGLGLTLARRIAVAHGGSIAIADVNGRGCRIVLTNPG